MGLFSKFSAGPFRCVSPDQTVGGILFRRLMGDGESERTNITRPQYTQAKSGAASSSTRFSFGGQLRKVYGGLGVWPTVKLEGIGSYGPIGIEVTRRGKSSVQQIVVGYLDAWYRHVDRGSSDNRPDHFYNLRFGDVVSLLKLA